MRLVLSVGKHLAHCCLKWQQVLLSVLAWVNCASNNYNHNKEKNWHPIQNGICKLRIESWWCSFGGNVIGIVSIGTCEIYTVLVLMQD